MDADEVTRWMGRGDAWEAYLGDPNCTFLGIYLDGELVGGHAVIHVNEATAQIHNLLTSRLRGHARVEALQRGMAWTFGPGGLSRLVGKTEASNKPALRYAVSMAGWSRLAEQDGHVWTALNIQDWPWRQARWMRAASGMEGNQGVMLGALARLVQAGAPARGVALYNEWAALLELPGAALLKQAPGEALIRCGRCYRVHGNGIDEVAR